jgi:hypothetical protein
MTTYYVSTAGSDSNNGLGPDASDATNKPWLTIAKALGAAGISSGDTVYVGPGVFREQVTVAMTSATVETFVLGDPQNSQGFRDGSGNLLAADEVRWTAWNGASDKVAPSGNGPTLSLAGRDFLTFRQFTIIGGSSNNGNAIDASAGTQDITIQDCSLISGGVATGGVIRVAMTAGATINWLIDRCRLLSISRGIRINAERHSADYDMNFLIRNCVFNTVNTCCYVISSGSGTGFAGGLDVLNCSLFGNKGVEILVNAGATSIPCTVLGSIILAGPGGLDASGSGQITEDYNSLYCVTNRINVSAGANTKDGTYSPLLEFGQAPIQNRITRPYLMPTDGSPLLGFGGSGPPTVDILNRPRPAGGQSTAAACGAYERHDSAVKETTVTDAGGVGLKITGPGDQDIHIPVNASSTTITIRVRYDTNHGTGTKPQAKLCANGEIGVSEETKTAAAGIDTWETLTFSAITPTAKGVVTVRLLSRSAADTGIAYFDTLSVA